MQWYHRHTDRLAHPQIRAAGFWPTAVFDALCDLSALHDLEGTFDDRYLDPVYLAGIMNLTNADCPQGASPSQVIAHGLQRLQRCALLELGQDGKWLIPGWGHRNSSKPMSSTERSRKRRERLHQIHDATTATQLPLRATGSLSVSSFFLSQDEKMKDGNLNALVYAHWRSLWMPGATETPPPMALALIQARRSELPALEAQQSLLDSLSGWINDSWNRRRYNLGIEILLRDAGQVQRGLAFFGGTRSDEKSADHDLTDEEKAQHGIT